MKLIKYRSSYLLLSAVAVVLGVGAFLTLPTASSATTTVIGSLAIELRPYGAQPELEDMTLTFTGAGELALAGWQLENEAGIVYTFTSATTLVSDESVLLCSTDNELSPGCIAAWGGTQWSDEAGLVRVRNAAGEVVASQTYTNITQSSPVYFSADLVALVYERNDAVSVCHLDNRRMFSSKKDRAWKVVDGTKGHQQHQDDIIPPFYYRDGGPVSYHSGLNWETKQALYEQYCSETAS